MFKSIWINTLIQNTTIPLPSPTSPSKHRQLLEIGNHACTDHIRLFIHITYMIFKMPFPIYISTPHQPKRYSQHHDPHLPPTFLKTSKPTLIPFNPPNFSSAPLSCPLPLSNSPPIAEFP